jgi:hypothetical protein
MPKFNLVQSRVVLLSAEIEADTLELALETPYDSDVWTVTDVYVNDITSSEVAN